MLKLARLCVAGRYPVLSEAISAFRHEVMAAKRELSEAILDATLDGENSLNARDVGWTNVT
jgi:hypothetical protein